MTTHRIPLVGMKFHPPALAILQCLPSGANLILVPEPENPFDSSAVIVTVASIEVPVTQDTMLGVTLGGYGYSLEDFRAPVPDAEGRPTFKVWHLGHLKANNSQDPSMSCAAQVAPLLGGTSHLAKLTFDLEGRPIVEVDLGGES